MAQHHILKNSILSEIINSISGKHFTTYTVVNKLESNYQDIFNEMKRNSRRNYQAVIGTAIKRFSIETNKIKQISSRDESPARWEKT